MEDKAEEPQDADRQTGCQRQPEGSRSPWDYYSRQGHARNHTEKKYCRQAAKQICEVHRWSLIQSHGAELIYWGQLIVTVVPSVRWLST